MSNKSEAISKRGVIGVFGAFVVGVIVFGFTGSYLWDRISSSTQEISRTHSGSAVGELRVIGSVANLVGVADVTRADGSKVRLTRGEELFSGDLITTGRDSSLKIEFVDETLFALGAGARLQIDSVVYNADGQPNELFASVLNGAFVFVSGLIAKEHSEDMRVSSPVATIGIRGTVVAGQIFSQVNDDDVFRIGLLDGEIDIRAYTRTYTLSTPLHALVSTSFLGKPTETGVQALKLSEIMDFSVDAFHSLDDGDISSIEDKLETALSIGGTRVNVDLRGEVRDAVKRKSQVMLDKRSKLERDRNLRKEALDGGVQSSVTEQPADMPGGNLEDARKLMRERIR